MWQRCILGVLTSLLWVAVSGQAHAAKRVALVIGNSKYVSTSELSNPINDSVSVAKTLRDVGFDEVRLVSNADHRGLLKALKSFTSAAAGAETAIVYYAGHGVEVDGRNYLVPVDAVLGSATDVDFEAVPLEHVRTAVSGASKLRLVILDACRNNPFKLASSDASRSVGRGLARVEPGSNELIAYAAREGTVASDGVGTKNSPFAASLVKHLAEPGLEVRLLFGRVRDEVMAMTGKQQEPFVYGSLGGEEIFLNPAVEASAPSKSDQAAEEWSRLSTTDDGAALAAFAVEFADTPFGGLAELRIMELRQRAAADAAAKSADERAREAEEELKQREKELAALEAASQSAETIVPLVKPEQQARALQTELARVGCLADAIDGKWGKTSAEALERFNQHANVGLETEMPSEDAIRVVQSQPGRICPLTCRKGFEIKDGLCIALATTPSTAKGSEKAIKAKGSLDGGSEKQRRPSNKQKTATTSDKKIPSSVPKKKKVCYTYHHDYCKTKANAEIAFCASQRVRVPCEN